jgi:uncharacterized LabA/DUF88 family protein
MIKESSTQPSKKFALYAFDVNNLFNSFKKKYEGFVRYRKNPMLKQITDMLLPKDRQFKAYFFASKHLEPLKEYVPPSSNIIWEIEDKVKRVEMNGTTIYSDVDIRLAAKMYNYIEQNWRSISTFTLGSGDKDLRIVCDLALKYKIPVNIIVIEKENLSRELREIASDIFEVYS